MPSAATLRGQECGSAGVYGPTQISLVCADELAAAGRSVSRPGTGARPSRDRGQPHAAARMSRIRALALSGAGFSLTWPAVTRPGPGGCSRRACRCTARPETGSAWAWPRRPWGHLLGSPARDRDRQRPARADPGPAAGKMAGQPFTEPERMQYLLDVALASSFLGQIRLDQGRSPPRGGAIRRRPGRGPQCGRPVHYPGLALRPGPRPPGRRRPGRRRGPAQPGPVAGRRGRG